VKKLFNDFIWQTSNNKILITFDDGPSATTTPKILDLLAKNEIRAAFFCLGKNIRSDPELTNQIIKEGHLIANHTMEHKLLNRMNNTEALEELRSFNKLMKEKFNYDIKYFRPPQGRFNLRTKGLLKNLDLKNVMWSLLSYDFENDFEKVKYGIDNYLRENSIVVFHDNIKSNSIIEESLNYTINFAENNAFEFGEPEDCLR
jgi:peptidoglycan/xylan/chitin deacetylase (PgdA/CDA1 family)